MIHNAYGGIYVLMAMTLSPRAQWWLFHIWCYVHVLVNIPIVNIHILPLCPAINVRLQCSLIHAFHCVQWRALSRISAYWIVALGL